MEVLLYGPWGMQLLPFPPMDISLLLMQQEEQDGCLINNPFNQPRCEFWVKVASNADFSSASGVLVFYIQQVETVLGTPC